jgi:protocatechuate 3,4-dioxygenase beta subunit
VGSPTSSAGATTTASNATTSGGESAGEEIPDETAGPFPADGTNGPNVLDDEGIVRPDITSSIGGSSGVADGVPISFNLSLVDAATGSAVPGGVVYLWHCTADGRYSLYEIEDENYLRGVQVADDAGRISFTSVFPGCYAGRWPHAHFEVYTSIEEATAGSAAIKTSQLALPQADCETVYADSRYGSSAQNLSRLSLDTDGIFADGWTDQLATMSGSVSDGYTASLLVRV